ncbi:hypothetical protein M501DRAFT_1004894 [Patellaria atrata CBS 101060]|uniref:Uncharacterized protein n=1 Tax=Patellaria atrata CBS 101060 TaxID=1346257 RepID=A0A9P4S8J7_9PEZI|nr:hypothetical protein M501DRAFT_1004894 [Patellaria atrata CBS 101060]
MPRRIDLLKPDEKKKKGTSAIVSLDFQPPKLEDVLLIVDLNIEGYDEKESGVLESISARAGTRAAGIIFLYATVTFTYQRRQTRA